MATGIQNAWFDPQGRGNIGIGFTQAQNNPITITQGAQTPVGSMSTGNAANYLQNASQQQIPYGDSTQLPGSGYGSGYSRTVTTSYTPADIATLEAAEQRNQRLLGSLGVARDASLQNISNQYATNQSRYNDAQAQANRSLNTQRRDNEDSKAEVAARDAASTAKNAILNRRDMLLLLTA